MQKKVSLGSLFSRFETGIGTAFYPFPIALIGDRFFVTCVSCFFQPQKVDKAEEIW